MAVMLVDVWGKSWIGCYFTDDKATRDKYEDDYCIFCCCLRFGCFSSAGSSVEEAVVSVEINEDHNLQSTSEKKKYSAWEIKLSNWNQAG